MADQQQPTWTWGETQWYRQCCICGERVHGGWHHPTKKRFMCDPCLDELGHVWEEVPAPAKGQEVL